MRKEGLNIWTMRFRPKNDRPRLEVVLICLNFRIRSLLTLSRYVNLSSARRVAVFVLICFESSRESTNTKYAFDLSPGLQRRRCLIVRNGFWSLHKSTELMSASTVHYCEKAPKKSKGMYFIILTLFASAVLFGILVKIINSRRYDDATDGLHIRPSVTSYAVFLRLVAC